MDPSDNDTKTLLEARIVELEMRLAEQDQALLALSDETFRQQQHIAQLETRLRMLTERVQTLGQREASPGKPEDERPPHY